MNQATGIEIGRFRLKSEVSEQAMRSVYSQMVDKYLSQQEGWCAQYLVTLQEGVFVDLAFAASQAQAQAICASWQGNKLCEDFLALIEPVSMEFGSVNRAVRE